MINLIKLMIGVYAIQRIHCGRWESLRKTVKVALDYIWPKDKG